MASAHGQEKLLNLNVDDTWPLVITLFAIGFIGSFVSGLIGIGGSVIKYPLLLYVPALLGLASYSAQEVAAISAVQVLFAAGAGVLALKGSGCIHPQLVAVMGTAVIVGSFVGGYGSRWLSDATINIVYAVLALSAVVIMLTPRPHNVATTLDECRKDPFHIGIAAGSAMLIGLFSGIVGAAGAFILVPIMLVVLRIPTRVALASSLAITFLSSIGATVGKVMTGHLLLEPATVMVIASLIAAPLGARLSLQLRTSALQSVLTLLLIATVAKVWWDFIMSIT